MDNEYIDSFRFFILPHDTDVTKKMTLCAVVNHLLDAAGMAANKRHFGLSYLHENGLAWVLSRYMIEVYDRVGEYEYIEIKTWVKSVTPIYSERCMVMYNDSGKMIAQASSLWSVIDMKSRKISDLTLVPNIGSVIAKSGDENFTLPMAKRVETFEQAQKVVEHDVVYSDIDMNRHVNSTKYLQWALDSASIDDIVEVRPMRLEINFLHEILYGQRASVSNIKKDNGAYVFAITTEKNCCCRIKMTPLCDN